MVRIWSYGIDMAMNEINAAGGITVNGKKHKFRLEKLDDKNDPTAAVNNARRLRNNGAIAVFNGVFTTIAAMNKINQEKGNEFLLMAYTSTPKFMQMGNKLLIGITAPTLYGLHSAIRCKRHEKGLQESSHGCNCRRIRRRMARCLQRALGRNSAESSRLTSPPITIRKQIFRPRSQRLWAPIRMLAHRRSFRHNRSGHRTGSRHGL